MKISKMIEQMDMGAMVQWLIDNQYNFDIVPVRPTKEMRRAFHNSLEKHENGEECHGSPDDQWLAMLNEHKSVVKKQKPITK